MSLNRNRWKQILNKGVYPALFISALAFQYPHTDLSAILSVGIHHLLPGGSLGINIDGAGDTIAIFDNGRVRESHQELSGRVVHFNNLQNAPFSDHCTGIAGLIGSSGIVPAARGYAPGVTLHIYKWNQQSPINISDLYLCSQNGVEISNHSYATKPGWNYQSGAWYWYGSDSISLVEDWRFGYYDHQRSRAIDSVLFIHPNHLAVFAAGNERGNGPSPGDPRYYFDNQAQQWIDITHHPSIQPQLDGGIQGFDCLGPEAVAKNVLTVGAVYKNVNGYQSPQDIIIDPKSAYGPTDDGRIKPEVVAPSDTLYTPASDSDTGYTSISRTSAATAVVSGAALLLKAYYNAVFGRNPLSSTLRGLIIHTADRFGNAPDYKTGFGVINAYKAAKLLQEDSALCGGGYLVREYTLNQGQRILIPLKSKANDSIRATLAWVDPQSQPLPINVQVINNRTSRLVNDLDLRIIDENQVNTFFPYVADPDQPLVSAISADNPVDNVEMIELPKNQQGNFILQISHKGVLAHGKQDFSLIISGVEEPDVFAAVLNHRWSIPQNWKSGILPDSDAVVFIPRSIGNLMVDTAVGVRALDRADSMQITIADSASLKLIVLGGKGSVLLKGSENNLAGIHYHVTSESRQIRQVYIRGKSGPFNGRWAYLGLPPGLSLQNLVPVAGTLVNLNFPGGSLLRWNAAIGNYEGFSSLNHAPQAGTGLLAFFGDNPVGTFHMPLPDTLSLEYASDSLYNLYIPLEYTSTPQNQNIHQVNDGWNLVSNPYPAWYDWYQHSVPGNATAIYHFNDLTGQWHSYNHGPDSLRYIAPLQAFWIRNASGQSAQLQLDTSRLSGSQAVHFFKSQTGTSDFYLRIFNDSARYLTDYLILGAASDASPYFDGHLDALKFQNRPPNPSVSVGSDTLYSIYRTNGLITNIPMNVRIYISGTYCFETSSDEHLLLTDLLENKQYTLDNASGICLHFNQGNYQPRFLVSRTPQLWLQESVSLSPSIRYSSNGVRLFNPLKQTLFSELYSIHGTLISRSIVLPESIQSLTTPQKGVYVLILKSKERQWSWKVVF